VPEDSGSQHDCRDPDELSFDYENFRGRLLVATRVEDAVTGDRIGSFVEGYSDCVAVRDNRGTVIDLSIGDTELDVFE
jgi:hypothetical protein